MRIAFVFPGQGSHRDQMAASWEGTAHHDVIARVGRAAGTDLTAVADDAVACTPTATGQPAIMATSLAALAALAEAGIRPDVVAGHSLGEFTAAVAADALSLEDGAAVVGERGRAMGRACAAAPGAMAAILRLDLDRVQEILAEHPDVAVANENAPGQVVISGLTFELDRAVEAMRQAGGRAIPLKVEGAFHSPAMAPAAVALREALARTAVAHPAVPLVTGRSGQVLRHADEVVRALVDGVLAPVRWVDVQDRIASLEIDLLIEVGPGGVLAGIARRHLPDIDVMSVSCPDDIAAVVRHVTKPKAYA